MRGNVYDPLTPTKLQVHIHIYRMSVMNTYIYVYELRCDMPHIFQYV